MPPLGHSPQASAQPAPDVEVVANETRDRIITGAVTILPVLALLLVAWQLWNRALSWHDLVVFAVVYALTGFGVTVGFHRHLTHRSFATTRWVRALLSVLGSAAVEGPVISWVADHRKHHAFSDTEGDPHSPHVGRHGGLRGALSGLVHAHVGWLFIHTHRGARLRYAPDLIRDRVVSFVDRTFVLWVSAGLLFPFGLGAALGRSFEAGLTGLLWGGFVRIFVVHHITYSINSLCHFFGRRRFDTGDESRNLTWLALPSLGEAWHNNHHAFPTSASHGLRRWERALDPSAAVIAGLERIGLAWDVVRIAPERQQRKTLAVRA